jgi:MoaA/NifB/PqqE/SkfB family radical SAM enzyme
MSFESELKSEEAEKRDRMRLKKPRVFEKFSKYQEKVAKGESIAILQFQYDYLCNFACEHCSADDYMLNTKEKKQKYRNARSFTFDDVRDLSRQGDEMGLANIVITGGEPMTYKDYDQLIEAIDPSKWYIASDTNGWFFDMERAKHVKSIGVDKIQISLDGLDEKQHDEFRHKPGSYKRVMRAIEAAKAVGIDLNISTVVWKSRIRSGELERFIKWADDNKLPLYMSLAKPVGSFAGRLEEVCNTSDIEYIDSLCASNSSFTHWTPSYGMDIGCIAVKRMVSISRYGDVMPCPYTHVSLGNVFKESLKEIIDRALQIKLFSFGKKETCYIGNLDHEFIHKHLPRYQDLYNEVYSAPYTKVFDDEDFIGGKTIPSKSFDSEEYRIPLSSLKESLKKHG